MSDAVHAARTNNQYTPYEPTGSSTRKAAEAGYKRLREKLFRVAAKEPVNPKAVNRELSIFVKSPDVHLYHGYKVTQQNDGKDTSGYDGVASVRLEDVPALVEGLSSRLGETEGPGLIRKIPKPDGGKRTITIFTMLDRVKASVIADGLNIAFGRFIPANSFAYVPGRGHHAAIAAAANHLSTVDYEVDAIRLDVKKMFRSIDPAAAIKGLEPNAYLGRILGAHTNVEVIDGGEKRQNEGLPEGSAISCFLANFYVRGWTAALTGSTFGVNYADDFYLFGGEKDVEASAAKIINGLHNKGLTVNKDKSVWMCVTAKPTIPNRQCYFLYPTDSVEGDGIEMLKDFVNDEGINMLGVRITHFLHRKPRPYVYVNLEQYHDTYTEDKAASGKAYAASCSTRAALEKRCHERVFIDWEGRGLERIPGDYRTVSEVMPMS